MLTGLRSLIEDIQLFVPDVVGSRLYRATSQLEQLERIWSGRRGCGRGHGCGARL